MGYEDTLGVVGIYEGGYYRQTGVWRATLNSKMNGLGVPFNGPQKEAFIYEFYKDIGDYLRLDQIGLYKFVATVPSDELFEFKWYLNGDFISGNSSIDLTEFGYLLGYGDTIALLQVDTVDATGLLRSTWAINQSKQTESLTILVNLPPTIVNDKQNDRIETTADITLTFSEPIQKGTGTIYLRTGSATGSVIESYDLATSNRVSVSGTTLRIDPTNDLAHDTQYLVTIGLGAVTDFAGNSYAGTSTYDFRTELYTAKSVWGSAADDLIVSSLGNERIDGRAGIDTVVYRGALQDYLIDLNTGTVKDSQTGRDGFDTLTNIERLQFTDTNIALDIAGTAGEAYRIYEAAFNRAPDLSGLGYWINAMDNGAALINVAGGFIGSDEFQSRYGNASDTDFIRLLYENVLDRQPDAAGYQFWQEAMDRGLTREGLLIEFSESQENESNVAPDIANGIYYTPWIT